MTHWIEVHNASQADLQVIRARWCDTFACRLRGLTFRRSLGPGEGLLLVEGRESRSGTAIHMWFVFMPLGVAWVAADGRVVDTRLALPWRLYAPKVAAKFILEGPPGMLESVAINDCLEFVNAAPVLASGP
ncbi:MAG: DUF192 domain-containing protein [Anaerolineales bacterium]